MKKLFIDTCKMHSAMIYTTLFLTSICLFGLLAIPFVEAQHNSKVNQLEEKLIYVSDEKQADTINTLINLENQEFVKQQEAGHVYCAMLLTYAIGGPILILLWLLEKVLYKTWRTWYEKH